MTPRLAVITTQLGASFINRHVEDLLPKNTVAVARYGGHPLGGFWQAPCPVFYLDRWALRLSVRVAYRLGAPDARLRERAIERFLRHHKVTVVLGEFLDQFLDFVPIMERMGMPYVVQGHGIDVSAALRDPEMVRRLRVYNAARAILTRSEFHRRRLIALGLHAEKVHVNFGGVDVPKVVPQRAPEACKRFLAVSRVDTKKGPIYLLEAFRLAAARDPEITLDVIGHGPLYEAMRQFVDACGLKARVRLHGYVPDEIKEKLFQECAVFIQHSITDPDTSDEEGLPAAIQEAMAHGMAVVSTRHAGIPEAVEEGVTGLLVDETDARGMAEAMLQAMPLASRLGNAGYLRAASQFTWADEKSRLLRCLAPDPAAVTDFPGR